MNAISIDQEHSCSNALTGEWVFASLRRTKRPWQGRVDSGASCFSEHSMKCGQASYEEFELICVVCGQRMMCDSSQARTVIECPTCSQKISAPQAPAPDAKFIVTSTRMSE
jgi:DNA-directed RNA polymerase subunit RPC12/RpoP